MKIISKIEKVNNRTIPNDVYNEFLEDCGRTAETLAMEEHTILDLFKTKRLRYLQYFILSTALCFLPLYLIKLYNSFVRRYTIYKNCQLVTESVLLQINSSKHGLLLC